MKVIPLEKGRYVTFPSPGQRTRRRWVFQNVSGEDWTAVTVQTGPSSSLGTLYELAGGTGDPPNIVSYQIRSPRNLSGGNPNTESLRDFFQPVEQNQTVSIRLDFDDSFESPEYIDIAFYYRDEDNVVVSVPGTIVEGLALPRADPGASTDAVTGAAQFGFARADNQRSDVGGSLIAASRVQRELRDLRRQISSIDIKTPNGLDPLAIADTGIDRRERALS